MKKFQFLLLDAGPIIKLFELGVWETFIEKGDVTITRTVANEAKYASREFEDIRIDLDVYNEQGTIKIEEVSISRIKEFLDNFGVDYKEQIHDGEKETLAFLCNSDEDWFLCAADGAVYRVLGFLGKGEQGISLEEVLGQIGLSRELKWEYTKKFRKKWTHVGQTDSIQGKSF